MLITFRIHTKKTLERGACRTGVAGTQDSVTGRSSQELTGPATRDSRTMCFMMRDAMGAIIETMDPGHLRLIKTTAGGVAAVVAFAALFQTECGLQSFDWMVPAIVIANIVCYVMSYYLPAVGNFEEWEWYVARENMSHKTLLSYQFAHASIGHITANMLTLIMVGSEVSQALGCNQLLFLALYLASDWVGGLFAALLSDAHTCTVGASGSVAGVIVALSVLRPNSAVYLLGDDTASNPLMLLMGTLVADLCRGGNISWEGHLGGGIAGGGAVAVAVDDA